MSSQVLFGTLFAFVIAAGSFVVRFLTLSGAIATFLLGVVVFGIGGWQWAIPIVTFFLLSSILSRYGRQRKKDFDSVFGKSDRRDGGQVLANGSIAGALVVLSAAYPIHDFYPLYLGAVAAATADTWGTEIGVLTMGRTISVLSFKPVSPGTSGGISETGTLAGALGALVIALSGYGWFSDLKTAIVIVLAGVAGSLIDSLLGATVQVQFRCEVCGKQTERTGHCGKPSTRISGVPWINNDIVNILCSLAGAAAAGTLSFVF